MYTSEAMFDTVAKGMLVWGVIIFVALQVKEAEYGRYSKDNGYFINGHLGWFIQELPSLAIPVWMMCFTESYLLENTSNRILLFCFIAHYIHRTLIYPLLLKGKPLPLFMVILAFLFCTVNGYLQGGYLLYSARYTDDWINHPQFIIGIVLFMLGLIINIHSDYILRNLRKPGETGYKIPTGGMFEYISGANFYGEILEWCGFALASNSLPAFAFAFSSCCNLGPRAVHHHRWYKEKFDDYPSNRKAIIPFVF